MDISPRRWTRPAGRTVAAALAGLALIGGTIAIVPHLLDSGPNPARTISDVGYTVPSDSGQNIANMATSYLGKAMGTKNDPNGNPPSWYEWWCADFAKYIWGKAGADTAGLNPLAASFEYDYAHQTFSATPQVGDVMVVGTSPSSQSAGTVTHVAIVTKISGGQVTTVGGDEGTGMWYQNTVQQQTTGAAVGSYFGTGSLDGTTIQNVYVYGYAAPYFAYSQPSSNNLYLRVADGGLAGNYATTGNGGIVQASSNQLGTTARYTFVPVPGKSGAYHLKSQATGKYLSARFDLTGAQRGTLYATADQPGQSETFYEQTAGSNQALYVYDGSGTKWYVSVEMNQGGTLRARTTQAQFDQNVDHGSWELFTVGS